MPTTVIETIGSGGTYATIAAWEAATDNDLVAADEIRIGKVIDSQHVMTNADFVTFSGAVTDSTRYRELTFGVTPGVYTPHTHVGACLYLQWGTTAANETGLTVAEDYFRITGLGIWSENVNEALGTSTRLMVDITGDNVTLDGVFARCTHAADEDINLSFQTFETSGTNTIFQNCIAMSNPRGVGRGSRRGFVFTASSVGGAAYNCIAYGHKRNQGIGFQSLASLANSPAIINCISVENKENTGSSDFVGLFPTFENNISTDGTATATITGNSNTPDPNSQSNQSATTLFLKPDAQDFTAQLSSSALNVGKDLSANFTTDIIGTTRTGSWDIGAYNSYGTPIIGAITTNTSSIGSAGGRDYATIQAWITATEGGSLYATNTIEIGELYDDSDFDASTTSIRFHRTVTTNRNYRRLTVNAGTANENKFEPRSGAGSRITGDGDSSNITMDIWEDYVQLFGFGIIPGGTGAQTCIRSAGYKPKIDALFMSIQGGTVFSPCLSIINDEALITNCIAVGAGDGTNGATRGYVTRDCDLPRIFNCIASNIDGGVTSYGFREADDVTRGEYINCIAFSSGSADFSFATAANSALRQQYNLSEDATAVGIGALPSETPSDVVVNKNQNNFHLVAGSPALKSGRNLTFFFSTDYAGTRRSAPFDRGAIEGLTFRPEFQPTNTEDVIVQDLCSCFLIERTDGVVITLTTLNVPISFRSRTYDPAGVISASARRSEAGLREKSMEVFGALTSDHIKEEDLIARRYENAKITEFIINHKFPFTQPLKTHQFTIQTVEHSSTGYTAQLTSTAHRLENNIGSIITKTCDSDLGDAKCTVDTEGDTETAALVDVVSNRFNFTVQSGSIPVAKLKADDFYGAGEVLFLTGLNQGLTFEIKSWVDEGAGSGPWRIKIIREAPFTIANGDQFILKPGCRKRYVADCITKWLNGINFQGEPYLPGTDRVLQTPIS